MIKHNTVRANSMMPPMEPSDESTAQQLELARRQGAAFGEAMHAMNVESGAWIQRAGEYEIAIVVEKAEGLWRMDDGELRWHEPTNENAHIEVVVRDGADGRFIPGPGVHVAIETAGGQPVGTHQQPFLHPWLYHYGRNWRIPGEDDYRIRVRIDRPGFHRHDHRNGKRYSEPVEVEFSRHIKAGQ
jgi:hypothetical protein